MKPSTKSSIVIVLLFILFAGAIFWRYDMNELQLFLEGFGIFAPIVFMLIMAVAIVISPIPSIPLAIIGGIVFGWLQGGTYAIVGGLIGAMVSFFISRKYGRVFIEKYLNTDLDVLDEIKEHNLVIFVFLSRLLPIFQFDIISYAAGLTNMKPWKFAITTLLGMAPITYIIAFYGDSLVSVNIWFSILLTVVIIAIMYVVHRKVSHHVA